MTDITLEDGTRLTLRSGLLHAYVQITIRKDGKEDAVMVMSSDEWRKFRKFTNEYFGEFEESKQ